MKFFARLQKIPSDVRATLLSLLASLALIAGSLFLLTTYFASIQDAPDSLPAMANVATDKAVPSGTCPAGESSPRNAA